MYSRPKFQIGQVVYHRLFGYRGVIIDIDPIFMLSKEWYEQMARSNPPKDQPWYHILVHNANHKTYVSELNLSVDLSKKQIYHPLLGRYFSTFINGRYYESTKID